MEEAVLHYIWQTRARSYSDLRLSGGEKLTVLKRGDLNPNAGPDFLNAQILLDDTLWAGHVEIHVRASDWFQHEHEKDPAYNNVILHVVLEYDSDVETQNKHIPPTLELKNHISSELLEQSRFFAHSLNPIPCHSIIHDVPMDVKKAWLQEIFIKRMDQQSLILLDLLEKLKGDWEALTLHWIGRFFGLSVNTAAFERLLELIPYKVLFKERNNLIHLEAILFGSSGLLPKSGDEDYVIRLNREYRYLKRKYRLRQMRVEEWKFSRMRPTAFPTIRIAFLAALLHDERSLWQRIRELNDVGQINMTLANQVSDYWREHYHFRKKTKNRISGPGKHFIDLLIINGVVPLLYIYGSQRSTLVHKNLAIEILSSLPAENNKIIRKWKDLGWIAKNARETQSLYYLFNEFCSNKACLKCMIGQKLLDKQAD